MGRPRKSFLERMEDFVIPEPNSGCWIWVGGTIPGGYAMLTIDNTKKSAHRCSYETFKGPIPDGMLVCHSCDIPSCVNPDHLFLGTASDNQLDCHRKGRRIQKGEKNNAAKLTNEQAMDIRSGRIKQADFCRLYGVSPAVVCHIYNSKTWKHLDNLGLKG